MRDRSPARLQRVGLIFGFCLICQLPAWTLSAAPAATLTVVTQNLNRMFDDRDDGNDEMVVSSKTYRQRLQRFANKLAGEFAFADIVAVQEVENRRVLEDVSRLVYQQHGVEYQAVLIEGNDVSGIDVGYLVKDGIRATSRALFRQNRYGYGDRTLFARPPLLLEACRDSCITVLNLHLRSMRGLGSSKHGLRVANKRKLQAETIARWINSVQKNDPDQALIVLGDFNALSPSDRYVDVLGTIKGEPDRQAPRWKSHDLIVHDLVDLTRRVPEHKRHSFLFKRRKQQLDYILASHNLESAVQSVRFSRIDSRFSDHAAVMATLQFD